MERNKHLSILSFALLALLFFSACQPDPPTPAPVHLDKNPRRIATSDGKLYVSCYNPASVIRIDTATYKVEASCTLGNFRPEGIAAADGRLFVVSSWNSTENGSYLYDDKVYVIDLNTFTVTATVTVGLNPQQVHVIDEGHVIVNYNGNYGDLPGGSAIINTATLEVTQTGQPLTYISVADGMVYGYASIYNADMTTTANYVKIDPNSLSITPILTDCGIDNPYSINVFGGHIYLTTDGHYTTNGDVLCLQEDGTRVWMGEAGMLPSKVVKDGSYGYILNEGSWGSNNASLSRVDLTTGAITNNVFSTANGRGLGDVAQDIVIYGTKAYISVTFSNSIEAMSLTDNKSTHIKL